MTVSSDFERGARAAIEQFKGYFQDENERAIHAELPDHILDMHAQGALDEVLRDEAWRLERES